MKKFFLISNILCLIMCAFLITRVNPLTTDGLIIRWILTSCFSLSFIVSLFQLNKLIRK